MSSSDPTVDESDRVLAAAHSALSRAADRDKMNLRYSFCVELREVVSTVVADTDLLYAYVDDIKLQTDVVDAFEVSLSGVFRGDDDARRQVVINGYIGAIVTLGNLVSRAKGLRATLEVRISQVRHLIDRAR